jgi:thioredoxin-related protein
MIFCKFYLISILFLSLGYGVSWAQGIRFESGDWKSIKAKAKKEKKYIFLDAYTQWCGPCRRLSATLFPMPEVGDFFNRHFISVKMDMEAGEGLALMQELKTQAFPTLYFFNPKGELVHISVGAPQQAKLLIQIANQALDPKEQLASLQKRYDKGERSFAFLRKYFLAADRARYNCEPVIKDILGQKSHFSELLQDTLLLEALGRNAKALESPVFIFFRQNFAKIVENIGDKNAARLLNYSYIPLLYRQQGVYHRIREELQQYKLTNLPQTLAELDFTYYSSVASDSVLAVQAAFEMVKNGLEDAQTLNELAWYVFENSNDTQKLEEALGWATKSVNLTNGKDINSLDTQAQLLAKLQRYPEALAVIRALETLASATNQTVPKETQELKTSLLKMIKN